MRRALLIAALVVLTALAAKADIRRFMQAKGYSSFITGACTDGCSNYAHSPSVSESQPPPVGTRCTLPAALPCTL